MPCYCESFLTVDSNSETHYTLCDLCTFIVYLSDGVVLQHGESYSGGCIISRDDTVKYVHSWVILKWTLGNMYDRDVYWVKLF